MYHFLSGWFPDFEDDLDKEIVESYKKTMLKEQLVSLKSEFEELFKTKDTNHEYISDLSNIYSENDDEMYEWLHELYDYLFEDK